MKTGFGPMIIKSAGIFSQSLIRYKNALPGAGKAIETGMVPSSWTNGSFSACYLILFTLKVISGMAVQVLTKPLNRCLAILFSLVRVGKATLHSISKTYRFFGSGHRYKTGYFNFINSSLLYLSAGQFFPVTQKSTITG
jgi:hypothetical protein